MTKLLSQVSSPFPRVPMIPLLSFSLTSAFPTGVARCSPGRGRGHCDISDLLQQLEDMENANILLGLSCLLPMQSDEAVGVLMPDMIPLNKSLRT